MKEKPGETPTKDPMFKSTVSVYSALYLRIYLENVSNTIASLTYSKRFRPPYIKGRNMNVPIT